MLKSITSLILLLTAMTSAFAQVAGTESNPIIISAGEPVPGPAASSGSPLVYTYYRYVTEMDGVISLDVKDLGNIMGTITIGEVLFNYKASILVSEGDTVNIKLVAETDATDKTFTLNIRDLGEGETQETAKVLVEGDNIISEVKTGGIPQWYKVSVPANEMLVITFSDYPSGSVEGIDGATFQYESRFSGYAVIASNNDSVAADLYVRITFATAQVATVVFDYICKPKTPIVSVGDLAFSIANGAKLASAPDSILITFPNIQGGEPDDDVLVAAYVFEAEDGLPYGAPINLYGYEYTGTLQDGVVIGNVEFEEGLAYIISISQVCIRETGNNGHGGKTYEYSYPNAEENSPVTLFFEVTGDDPSSVADIRAVPVPCDIHNLSGQRAASAAGLVIIGGQKVMVK
ncbi:MAG: hypothetical protein KBT20_05155 [Bacteroidales bacterium]|nr:hypothetical protein [Candidatus Liminaster caballi]